MFTSDSPARSPSEDAQLLAQRRLGSDPREERKGRQASLCTGLEDPRDIAFTREFGKRSCDNAVSVLRNKRGELAADHSPRQPPENMLDRDFVVAYSGNSEIVVCGMIMKNRSLPLPSTTRTPPGLRAAAMARDRSRSNSSIVICRRFGCFLRAFAIVEFNIALL